MSFMQDKHQSMVRILLLTLLPWFVSCGYFSSEPNLGIYRGVMEVPGGKLPFWMELAKEDDTDDLAVFLLNVTERTALPPTVRTERTFELSLPNSGMLRFSARRDRLTGTIHLASIDSSEREFPFQAETGLSYRFFSQSTTDNADVAGHWSVSVLTADHTQLETTLEFEQSHDLVTGILQGQDASQLILSGQIKGDELRLSRFDGEQAILIIAILNAEGELEGEIWTNFAGSTQWRATRNPDKNVEPQNEPLMLEMRLERYL